MTNDTTSEDESLYSEKPCEEKQCVQSTIRVDELSVPVQLADCEYLCLPFYGEMERFFALQQGMY